MEDAPQLGTAEKPTFVMSWFCPFAQVSHSGCPDESEERMSATQWGEWSRARAPSRSSGVAWLFMACSVQLPP